MSLSKMKKDDYLLDRNKEEVDVRTKRNNRNSTF